MKNRYAVWVGLCLLVVVLVSGGCIDVAREGVTGGIRDGLSQVTTAILNAVIPVPAGG